MPTSWEEHWRGMPEVVATKKTPFHTLRVMLSKQPPPVDKTKGFIPFVTIHFTENGFNRQLSEVAKRLDQSITSETERITLNTDEVNLANLLFGERHNIGHHSTWFPWKGNEIG